MAAWGLFSVRFQPVWLLLISFSVLAAGCAEDDDGNGGSQVQPYEALEGMWTLNASLNVGDDRINVPGSLDFAWNSGLAMDQTFVSVTQQTPFDSICGIIYRGPIQFDADTESWSGKLEVDPTDQLDTIDGLALVMVLEPRFDLEDEYRVNIQFDASATGDSIHQTCEIGPGPDGVSGSITRDN